MEEKDLHRFIAEHFGRKEELRKLREECLELAEAVDDYLREGDTPETYAHLIEEMADVGIVTDNLSCLLVCREALRVKRKEKIARTIERIRTGYYEDKEKKNA